MTLCDRAAIVDLLLVNYVDACEQQNPGIVERTIEAVSGEIGDAVGYRYPQPWPQVPSLIRHIAAVTSAYRVVEAITSLVATEGSTDNEWLPLQNQWKHCNGLLKDIRDGKLKLPLAEANADREEASIAVVARPPLFDLRGF